VEIRATGELERKRSDMRAACTEAGVEPLDASATKLS
jgi:hypothetical protein